MPVRKDHVVGIGDAAVTGEREGGKHSLEGRRHMILWSSIICFFVLFAVGSSVFTPHRRVYTFDNYTFIVKLLKEDCHQLL